MSIAGIAQGVGAAGDALGMIQSIGAGKRQQKRSKELMGIQFENQSKLNAAQAQDSKDMWDYTNYGNQVKHLEEAGLNVGMMYGGGGGGGATTSGTSAGSASAGGGGAAEQIASSGNLAQLGMMKAQTDMIEAQAEKARAETENIRGVDRENRSADTNLKTADTALRGMQTENAKLQNQLQSESIESLIDTVKANADKAQSEARSGVVKANVDENTQKSTENQIRSEALNEAFKLTLMKADANLKNENARAVTQELAQEWERLTIELQKVGVSKMQNAINEFTAKVNARLGQGNLNMRGIEAGLNAAGKIIGGGKNVDMSGKRNTTISNY